MTSHRARFPDINLEVVVLNLSLSPTEPICCYLWKDLQKSPSSLFQSCCHFLGSLFSCAPSNWILEGSLNLFQYISCQPLKGKQEQGTVFLKHACWLMGQNPNSSAWSFLAPTRRSLSSPPTHSFCLSATELDSPPHLHVWILQAPMQCHLLCEASLMSSRHSQPLSPFCSHKTLGKLLFPHSTGVIYKAIPPPAVQNLCLLKAGTVFYSPFF